MSRVRIGTCTVTDPRCQHTRAADYGNLGCRCTPAREAYLRRKKLAPLRPPPMVPITGTRRRLQALMAIGWSQPELCALLGRNSASLSSLLWQDQREVTRLTEQKVRDLYDQMWATPGSGARAGLVASRAQRRGWLAPLWWDDDRIDDPTYTPDVSGDQLHWSDVDEVAIDLACAGRDVGRKLTRAEKVTAVLRLSGQGLDLGQIAERTGIHRDQAGRYLRDFAEQVA